MSNPNSELWSYATPNARLVTEAIIQLTDEVARLNRNLESGMLSVRTHHPLCVSPKDLDATMAQAEAISKFIGVSLASGALVLPKEGEVRP